MGFLCVCVSWAISLAPFLLFLSLFCPVLNLFSYYFLAVCQFSDERQQECGSRYEQKWRGNSNSLGWGNNNQNISIKKSIFNTRKNLKCVTFPDVHHTFPSFFYITKKIGLTICSYSLLINTFYIPFLLKMMLKKAMHKIPHGWNNKHSPQVTDLNTWSPAGVIVCKGYSSFRRQTLIGRNASPGVDFLGLTALSLPAPTLYFLQVAGDVTTQIHAPDTCFHIFPIIMKF